MPTSESPLRYPGGKSKFYTYIRAVLECNDLIGETYIEPFAGGAGVALKLLLNGDVRRIIINDLDVAIYSFWYSVLNHTDDLCTLIENTDINQAEWRRQKEIYNRKNSNNMLELGFATFFLNRTNVSGVIKGGVIGGQNQEGAYKIDARFNKVKLIDKIQRIASFKKQIVLLNLDACDLLSSNYLRRFYKVLVNLDPPYVKKGAQLYKNSFTENDHKILKTYVEKCNRKWIVTYDICPLIADLYKNYRRGYLDVTYSVQGSKKAKEYIFFSKNLTIPDFVKIIDDADLK